MRLQRNFYLQPTLKVAKSLLGKIIVRKINKNYLKGRIIETEAYIGPWDLASHAKFSYQPTNEKIKILNDFKEKIKDYVDNWEIFSKRILKSPAKLTPRNIAEFLKGGHIYIYLVYGNFWQLNITTFKEGYPECVLIRAVEPLKTLNIFPDGPGKVCQFLKLNKSFLFEDLTKSQRIWLENGKKKKNEIIITTPRIGIDYAQSDKFLPWRFILKKCYN